MLFMGNTELFISEISKQKTFADLSKSIGHHRLADNLAVHVFLRQDVGL